MAESGILEVEDRTGTQGSDVVWGQTGQGFNLLLSRVGHGEIQVGLSEEPPRHHHWVLQLSLDL